MMKRSFFAASILSFALASFGSAPSAFSQAGNGEHYTKSQLKRLAQDAHTPEQYKTLAAIYGTQQKDYLRQADEAKQEWLRRSQITTSLYAKYPRPADSARNLYEYYVVKASEADALSAKYSLLAEPIGPAAQQRL
jgi:hypothetical protein